MAESTYSVDTLAAVRFPWLVRFRMRTARKKHLTGLVIHGIIKTSPTRISRMQPSAGVGEDGRLLAFCSSHSPLPKLVPLQPGMHDLLFAGTSTSFEKRVMLNEGDVLVAICEPAHPWALFTRKSMIDKWYLGVTDQMGGARPVE